MVFDEKYFIYLYQTIGNKKIQILCFSFYFHNNERLYYQIRNSFYFFSKKYVPFLYGLREIFSVLFHHFILFFYAKKKLRFLKKYILGIKDGIKLLIYR